MSTKRGDAEDLLMYIYSSMHASVIDVDESGGVVYHRIRTLCIVYFFSGGGMWSTLYPGADLSTFEEFKKWCARQIKSIEGSHPGIKVIHLGISSLGDETIWNDGNGVDLSGYLSNS